MAGTFSTTLTRTDFVKVEDSIASFSGEGEEEVSSCLLEPALLRSGGVRSFTVKVITSGDAACIGLTKPTDEPLLVPFLYYVSHGLMKAGKDDLKVEVMKGDGDATMPTYDLPEFKEGDDIRVEVSDDSANIGFFINNKPICQVDKYVLDWEKRIKDEPNFPEGWHVAVGGIGGASFKIVTSSDQVTPGGPFDIKWD